MTGYFDNSSEFKPLIHTWSLSLEEQFYIVVPSMLVALWRFGVRWTVIILSIPLGLHLALRLLEPNTMATR